MSVLTLLNVVNRAEREIGLTASTTVVGNTAQQAIEMLNLYQALGYDLVYEYDWQRLIVEERFSTVFYSYTGTTTSGSTTLSALSSTTGLTTNPTYFTVTGTGIPEDTELVSVNAGAGTAVISREATVTGTTVTLTFSQTKYAMDTQFERLIDRTQWDKSNNWEMLGPETPQQWQWLKSSNLGGGPRLRFRVLQNLFQVFPPPTTEQLYGFEYVGNYWVATSSTAQPTLVTPTADTDVAVFPDRLMVAGLKLRFAEEAGMPWLIPTLAKQYARLLDQAKANDGGSATLSMAPRNRSFLLNYWNIPDNGYGT